MDTKRIELPWAIAKKPGFSGEAPGMFFHYFRTADEAKRCRRALLRKKEWCGKVEYRPDECYRL